MKSMTVYDSMLPAFRGVFKADPFAILNRIFDDEYFPGDAARSPVVDVREKDGRYLIEAELPGVSEKDLKLELKNGLLTLSTEKKEESKEKDEAGMWIRREGARASSREASSCPRTPTARRSRRASKTASSPSSFPRSPRPTPASCR